MPVLCSVCSLCASRGRSYFTIVSAVFDKDLLALHSSCYVPPSLCNIHNSCNQLCWNSKCSFLFKELFKNNFFGVLHRYIEFCTWGRRHHYKWIERFFCSRPSRQRLPKDLCSSVERSSSRPLPILITREAVNWGPRSDKAPLLEMKINLHFVTLPFYSW